MSASSTLPDADEEQHVLAALYGDEADIGATDIDPLDTRLPDVPSAFDPPADGPDAPREPRSDPQAEAPDEEGRDARR